MSQKTKGREPKYTEAFKIQLVAESREFGATVPMISKLHDVPSNQIYAWRGDARFQPVDTETTDFTRVEVPDAPELEGVDHVSPEPRIVITLENGRKLSISNGVDAGFVLELALGLAA